MSALAHYAAAAGEAVHVFADGDKQAARYDSAENTDYRITRFGGLKPLRRRVKSAAIAKSMTKDDYIFADSWKSLEHLPAGLGVPVIAYAHGNEYPHMKDGRYPKQARIRQALSKAAHLVAVSRDTAARTQPFLPEGLTPQIIHPPVEPAAPAQKADIDYAQKLWPKPGATRLLALCRLIEWKGIDRAVQALKQLTDEGLEAQLVIAGIGDDRARLETLVDTLELTDRTVFAGRVEGGRKSALYSSADIFVQPGRSVNGQHEGFGITYIEAALHGLPSLSGRAGGAPDAVIDGKTGLVIDAQQLDTVSAALRQLVTDKNKRARMSTAAKAHGEAALWPRQIERILALKN